MDTPTSAPMAEVLIAAAAIAAAKKTGFIITPGYPGGSVFDASAYGGSGYPSFTPFPATA
jgi:hypothetical protein